MADVLDEFESDDDDEILEDADDLWDDEDDDEPLPVIDQAGIVSPPTPDAESLADSGPGAPIPPPRRGDGPKGNVKRADAAAARLTTTSEAQGRTMREADEWREQLAAGERGKAASSLAGKRHTHNSGSGFGLA